MGRNLRQKSNETFTPVMTSSGIWGICSDFTLSGVWNVVGVGFEIHWAIFSASDRAYICDNKHNDPANIF